MNATVLQVRIPNDRDSQRRALHEIRDLMRDRKVYRLDQLEIRDQLYCAALFLGTHRNWADDLVPAECPELYALLPQMLMADSNRQSDAYSFRDKLWDVMRRACLKQAYAGVEHERQFL